MGDFGKSTGVLATRSRTAVVKDTAAKVNVALSDRERQTTKSSRHPGVQLELVVGKTHR